LKLFWRFLSEGAPWALPGEQASNYLYTQIDVYAIACSGCVFAFSSNVFKLSFFSIGFSLAETIDTNGFLERVERVDVLERLILLIILEGQAGQ
jgi:hypothetical protein